jgi:hypothetical protein
MPEPYLKVGHEHFFPHPYQFIIYSIHAGSGAHPASYPVGMGGSLPGVKQPGREADHSSPSNAKVKNGGAVPLLHHTS